MIRAGRRALAGGVALLLAFSQSPGQSATSSPEEDPLVGLWAAEVTFGPALRGDLTLTLEGSTWRATLANAETSFPREGDAVRFTFPRNVGGFRGVLGDGGRAITGFWLQPPGGTQDARDPGGSGQSFASPLVLQRVGRNAWRGSVEPLEDRFTLYLRIFRDPAGSLLAAFRNPEQNSIGGSTQFRVTRDGETVEFRAGRDPAQPEIRHTATLVRSPDRLRISWPDVGRVLELARATPAQAAGFFPRPPGATAYEYAKPPATGDGWATAPARDVGMDETVLARLVRRLIDADPSTRRPALIHSLLVARRGKLVLEEYFFGFDREKRHDIRSAGKTFGSVLLGVAMMRGKRIAPETPVYGLLAPMKPFANLDPRKARITVAHLMTHTSGLACDDNDAGVLLRLGVLLGNGPRRGQCVAGAHRRLEAAAVLQVGDRGPGKVNADWRGDQRAGEGPVQDAAAEHRLLRKFFVHMQRIEIAEHARAEHDMRLGDGDARAEALAHVHFVIPFAMKNHLNSNSRKQE